MNRRKIEDVEAEPLDVGEVFFDIGERSVAAAWPGRPGEELVPRAESRLLPVDDDRQLAVVAIGEPAIRVSAHQGFELAVEQVLRLFVGGTITCQELGPEVQPPDVFGGGVLVPGPFERGADQKGPFLEMDPRILSGIHPLAHGAVPGEKVVDPGFEGEAVSSDVREREVPLPTIIDQRRHRHFVPLGVGLLFPEQRRREGVVAVGEQIGLDRHPVADDSFCGEPTTVDLRLHPFDHDTFPTVLHTPPGKNSSCY